MNAIIPTVYLLQEPTRDRDLSSAAQYGKIIPVISNQERPSENPIKALNKIASLLSEYNASKDYLCFAGGDPLVMFLSGVALFAMGFEDVTFLIWERERSESGQRSSKGFYIPKNFSIIDLDPIYLMSGDEYEYR